MTNNYNKDKPALTVPIRVEMKCLPTINYSLVHANVPYLLKASLLNNNEMPLNDVRLQIVLPNYAESQTVTIALIPANGEHIIDPLPQFRFYHHKFRDLIEPDIVPVTVWVNNEQILLDPPIEVKVLPPNAWHCIGTEEALTGFIMPHAVDEIVSRARFELRRLVKGAQGFADTFESSDPKAIEKTLQALYLCLQERYSITYEYEPRSYAPNWQLVRFHHEVLEELAGTCVDLALLFAACLENVHRDPLIILVKTGQDRETGDVLQHAIIGCWRRRSHLKVPVIRDEAQVRQWVNSGDLLVLDSKGFALTNEFPQGMDFNQCRKKAVTYIENYRLCYALDIVAARGAGIAPMPFGKGVHFGRSAWLAIFRARQEAERLQSRAVGARHLLLGLLSIEKGLMREVLGSFGEAVADKVADLARKSIPRTDLRRCPLPEDENWPGVLLRAEGIAACRGDSLVTEGDLATALLKSGTQVDRVLESEGLQTAECLDVLQQLLRGQTISSEWNSTSFVRGK